MQNPIIEIKIVKIENCQEYRILSILTYSELNTTENRKELQVLNLLRNLAIQSDEQMLKESEQK